MLVILAYHRMPYVIIYIFQYNQLPSCLLIIMLAGSDQIIQQGRQVVQNINILSTNLKNQEIIHNSFQFAIA